MIFKGQKEFLIFLLVTSLAGCTGLFSSTPEERVLARSQERLDLLMDREAEAAFAYASPGYRASHTVLQYDKKFGGAKTLWQAARAAEAYCDQSTDPVERCKVRVEIDYTTRSLGYMETTDLTETWIKSGGDWYIFVK